MKDKEECKLDFVYAKNRNNYDGLNKCIESAIAAKKTKHMVKLPVIQKTRVIFTMIQSACQCLLVDVQDLINSNF